VRDRTVFVTYFVVWIVLERRYLREYSQSGEEPGGQKEREKEKERASPRQDMIARRGGLQRLEVCMGEGCQSCVVERDSTALLHP
jgi:hypothetical protein